MSWKSLRRFFGRKDQVESQSMDRPEAPLKVFCYFERRSFDRREFRFDDEWGLVHVGVDPEHNHLGTLIDPPGFAFEQLGGM